MPFLFHAPPCLCYSTLILFHAHSPNTHNKLYSRPNKCDRFRLHPRWLPVSVTVPEHTQNSMKAQLITVKNRFHVSLTEILCKDLHGEDQMENTHIWFLRTAIRHASQTWVTSYLQHNCLHCDKIMSNDHGGLQQHAAWVIHGFSCLGLRSPSVLLCFAATLISDLELRRHLEVQLPPWISLLFYSTFLGSVLFLWCHRNSPTTAIFTY